MLGLQLGQSGNQVGFDFYHIGKEVDANELFHCNNEKLAPRCIGIDTEPKVISRLRNSKVLNYKRLHEEQSGCGNNWALGFNGTKHKLEDYMESIRLEMETMDRYTGSVLIHSLAGGTGSGLGCRLLQEMRDTYPKPYLMCNTIAPFKAGDTVLQQYNAVLSIEKLKEYADCVLYKDNDTVQRMVLYWKKKKKSGDRVSLEEMNQVIAHDLASVVLQPEFTMANFVNTVCPMPSMKFVDTRCGLFMQPGSKHKTVAPHALVASFPEYTVEKMLQYVLHSYKDKGKSIATMVSVDGFTNRNVKTTKLIQTLTKKHMPFVPWNASMVSVQYSNMRKHRASSIAVSTNNTSIVPKISRFIEKSSLQYNANAYLHWYARHGIEKDDIKSAIDACHQVCMSYTS